MTLYGAFLKAAAFIKATPQWYEFGSVDIPHTCDSPGCALGWIQHFSNIPGIGRDLDIIEGSHIPTIKSDQHFYDAMDSLSKDRRWRDDATECARAIRLYAKKHKIKLSKVKCSARTSKAEGAKP